MYPTCNAYCARGHEARGWGEHVLPARQRHPQRYRPQTVSCFLPFCLRRLITLRPPLVRMRARKPCTLYRRLVFGCQVRFGTCLSCCMLTFAPRWVRQRHRERTIRAAHCKAGRMNDRTCPYWHMQGSVLYPLWSETANPTCLCQARGRWDCRCAAPRRLHVVR